MTIDVALVLYLACGLAVAVVLVRVDPSPLGCARAVVAVPLWPLWGPIVYASRSEREAAPPSESLAEQRIGRALREGVLAAKGSPLASLLDEASEARLLAEVARAASRAAELAAFLERADLRLGDAEHRVEQLAQAGGPDAALAMARVHLENVRRLHALHAHDVAALDELAELVEALRTQLVLARYAGSSVERIGGVVEELHARVAGLGEAFEP